MMYLRELRIRVVQWQQQRTYPYERRLILYFFVVFVVVVPTAAVAESIVEQYFSFFMALVRASKIIIYI